MPPDYIDFFRDAEWLWGCWLSALIALGVACFVLGKNLRVRNPRLIWAEESGLSMTLAFVLTVPILLLICGFFAELSLLLLAKIGTVYASYAAARCAAVWEFQDVNLRGARARAAVVTAMAPFAVQARSMGTTPSLPAPEDLSAAPWYALALRRFSGTQIDAAMAVRQYLATGSRTTFKIDIPSRESGEPVTAEVTYRSGFLVPGAGRLLDPDGRWPWEYPLTSRTSLPLELPVSSEHTIGIDYRSF
ncbi:MAG: hypothetical protein RLZZ232_3114 [Planctomycetota bacterium]|jgi:hypothetical protein